VIAIRAAYLLKPGKDHPDEKWWFDIEYVGDTLSVPGEGCLSFTT